MDFPKFPCIEFEKNITEIVENPLLENFLQNFISQLVAEITQLEASCNKLKNSIKDTLAVKEKYLKDIFAITYDNKGDDILPLQLSNRMQKELGMFRLGEQRVIGLLERFHGDYKDWRLSLEQQMQKSLGTEDELCFLPQQQLNNKLDTLGGIAKNAENELNALENTAEHKNKLLDGKLREMQEEVHKLQSLKTEISAAQQQLIDEINEKQFKCQQDTNKLLREIASLQEKLDLYE
ncbi:uncharacterized protein LOC105209920 [Zeugodacus cucurbitae]|uniref:uncharacterized protein LOC105209920 n=1 Tax=Zeugodacus cucurbitae TaxID=28588 RepID=UPI0023D94B3B|nr:uncharacterized protein LOC105209920 [Zeugodacus cucurbitae]